MNFSKPNQQFSHTVGDRILYEGIQHLLVECHRPEMPKLARRVGKTRISLAVHKTISILVDSTTLAMLVRNLYNYSNERCE